MRREETYDSNEVDSETDSVNGESEPDRPQKSCANSKKSVDFSQYLQSADERERRTRKEEVR